MLAPDKWQTLYFRTLNVTSYPAAVGVRDIQKTNIGSNQYIGLRGLASGDSAMLDIISVDYVGATPHTYHVLDDVFRKQKAILTFK